MTVAPDPVGDTLERAMHSLDQIFRDRGNVRFQIWQIEQGWLPRHCNGIDTLADLQKREKEASAILNANGRD